MAVSISDPTAVVVAPDPVYPEPPPPAPEAPLTALCGENLTPIVTIDGVDVTSVSVRGGWTPRLNRPAQATVTLPMEEAIGDCGSLLKIQVTNGVDAEIVFHGRILNMSTDTDKDGGTTVYNAQDAMELWQFRPVRADDGDFSKPAGSGAVDGSDIIATYVTGPLILEAMLNNSENAGSGPPNDAEGPIGLTIGSFAGGGTPLYGAPVDWPMTIMELYSLLVSTGTLDAVITYTDPGGGITGTINGYNGNYGTDLSGSVSFQYGMGDYNAASLRWNRDMTSMVNKYWLYGGPRIETAADPAGEQHWCFNIQGQDMGLPYPPGGQSVDIGNFPAGPPWTDNQLGEKIYDSRQAYDVRMKIDIFDAYDDDCIPGFGTPGRMLYRKQWQVFSWFACEPRELIHITPVSDMGIGCFGIGDLVTVEAAAEVRGGFSGAQRIYEYTVSWEGTPSVLTLSELQTSSDMEGV